MSSGFVLHQASATTAPHQSTKLTSNFHRAYFATDSNFDLTQSQHSTPSLTFPLKPSLIIYAGLSLTVGVSICVIPELLPLQLCSSNHHYPSPHYHAFHPLLTNRTSPFILLTLSVLQATSPVLTPNLGAEYATAVVNFCIIATSPFQQSPTKSSRLSAVSRKSALITQFLR